jgi:hypothetical protein
LYILFTFIINDIPMSIKNKDFSEEKGQRTEKKRGLRGKERTEEKG